jgi:hypothetical protein
MRGAACWYSSLLLVEVMIPVAGIVARTPALATKRAQTSAQQKPHCFFRASLPGLLAVQEGLAQVWYHRMGGALVNRRHR